MFDVVEMIDNKNTIKKHKRDIKTYLLGKLRVKSCHPSKITEFDKIL